MHQLSIAYVYNEMLQAGSRLEEYTTIEKDSVNSASNSLEFEELRFLFG